jgi:bacterioferritin
MSETTTKQSKGIFDSENKEDREKIVGLLTKAYWMEIETVINYITNSVNVDGIRAQ